MYAYVITALIAALTAAAGTWQVQNWRYAAKETERVTAQAETDRLNARSFARQQDRVITVQNEAAVRARDSRAADRRAGDALDGLRVESDNALRKARESHEACIANATALRAVSDSCAAEYREMGRTAQGHADDAKTLSDAWPTE